MPLHQGSTPAVVSRIATHFILRAYRMGVRNPGFGHHEGMKRLLVLLALLSPSLARADNPFGVALWPAAGQDYGLVAMRLAGLGVAWYRPPSIYLDHWRPDSCPACRALAPSGLSLALTVRNGEPRHASAPPTDMAAFARQVGAVLDQWKPAMLVVEDEEDQPARYRGSPADYKAELSAACAEAHRRHATCSNGGLSFQNAIRLTWRGLKGELACDYAKRVGHADWCGQTSLPDSTDDKLIEIYRSSPIDAVNIHWFGTDANALSQTLDILAKQTGKPLMSNEIGVADATHVRPVMRAAMAGHMVTAIWYSVDGAESQSLFDNLGRLRPAGEEFAHQMSGRK